MQEPEKRWGANGCNYKSSPHFYSAIQKYGWDNFEHNILFTGLNLPRLSGTFDEKVTRINSYLQSKSKKELLSDQKKV